MRLFIPWERAVTLLIERRSGPQLLCIVTFMTPTMEYTSTYHNLKSQFSLSADEIKFSDSHISCRTFSFHSRGCPTDDFNNQTSTSGIFSEAGESIRENQSFTYPVIFPDSGDKFGQAIVLLHGLNERSWTKYLVWAYFLAEKTGRPVILFPIAYHMNRSPLAWSNPRIMTPLLTERNIHLGHVPMASFANLALSERLSENPVRFVTSGVQSAGDLEQLVLQISAGNHPLFEKGAHIDLFAYSIGAFLAQIVMLANPGNLFTDSRLFIFCGGAFFDQMDGTSKLIMDKNAFDCLRKYYIQDLGTKSDNHPGFAEYLKSTQLGMAFSAMLSSGKLKAFREGVFSKLKNQISSVVLKNDKVIPAAGTLEALGGGSSIEVMDFPYEYSHEIPFPVGEKGIIPSVDAAFKEVFRRASEFLR